MKRHRVLYIGMVLCTALVLVLVGTVSAFADLSADLSITKHVDTPDPVVGSNTVQYEIQVTNAGPDAAADVHIDDYMVNDCDCTLGVITNAYGSGWTCTISLGTARCDSGALANGATTPSLFVLVTAPDFAATITNEAHVTSTTTDGGEGSNYSDQSTTVITDTSDCFAGQVSCGTGVITYNLDSQVTTGNDATSTNWFVGTTFFKGVPDAVGSQVWSMFAPAVPENFCPLRLGLLTKCTFEMIMDNIPAPYPAKNVVFVGICDKTHCPKGILGGLTLVVTRIGDNGKSKLILSCAIPLTNPCSKTSRLPNGDLKIEIDGLAPGDPRIGGLCLGGGC